MRLKDRRAESEILGVVVAGMIVIMLVVAVAAYPVYGVWRKEMAGKASLAEAEWSKQIAIEEAKATLESAHLYAESAIIAATGVAEANKIIGSSLKENEEYLWYLWIQGLHDGSSEIIYIPTEANMPILEATRHLQAPSARTLTTEATPWASTPTEATT